MSILGDFGVHKESFVKDSSHVESHVDAGPIYMDTKRLLYWEVESNLFIHSINIYLMST